MCIEFNCQIKFYQITAVSLLSLSHSFLAVDQYFLEQLIKNYFPRNFFFSRKKT